MNLFGSGLLWGTPLTNAQGAAVAAATPLIFGTLQDTDLDFKFELKQLYGQNQFAVAVGRGKASVSGKAKFADIRAGFLETIIFGVAGADGLVGAVYDTVGVQIPDAAPYAVVVDPPANGVWASDLGVISGVTGRELHRSAGAPATGQYSVANGIYTFDGTDKGKLVFVNYRYNAASTVARKITIANQPMGYAPSFRADFFGPYMGKSVVLTLNNCISEGIKLSPKNDDFSVPEMGFQAFADAAGVVGVLSVSE